ncbi:enamine deaminase RidA (YjgF/YER057c/UK114 family) [Flagellimonas meridianipacifica]|uniref:Enamine deaminase RidA (YjgF/YER057c/UK114 family) n=2 Tax=Flagellimonas meridianipacifica TaxID=1080225 RepID=A0A2T0MF95_9FLAO|nr:enamine deaminase RidA (YjgF/YER057c/UK114 family) [Allomuricauda pacifica]
MERITVLAIVLLTIANLRAQEKTEKNMERKEINPWTWQDERHYAQAIEVKNPERTLYISGQTAIDANGISSTADFKSQLLLSIANLEEVLVKAGYKNTDITRITLYTTSFDELGQNFGTIQEWIVSNNIRTAITVVEVSKLFETTVVELEATAAK